MAKVEVSPQEFRYVKYDAGEIAALVARIADEIGLPADTVVEIDIDETTPATRARVESLDPIRLKVEGGAIEDPTVPRTLSERLVADVIGRLLLRCNDRATAGFGDAPPDADLDLAHQSAWDTACMGRLERLGYDVRKPRRLYHFRNRHGFSDVADRAFDRLWAAESVTWGEIEAVCAETAATRATA